jgi:hypothetical protein
MTTSGTKTWTITRNEIIQSALRKIGAYDSSAGAAGYEYTDAAMALNAIAKEWSAEGAGLWLRQTTCLILGRKRQYLLGPSGDHAFPLSILKENAIASDEATGQTALSIEDDDWVDYAEAAANKPISGAIGVRLDDGNIHWSTISSVGTDTVTLAAALPSAVSAGRKVYTHATYTSRPIELLEHPYREDTDGNSSQVTLIGRNEYESLSQKGADGDPTQCCFDPQLTNAVLKVWPALNTLTTDKLVFVSRHYSDDFSASTDNPEFPVEWANALIWQLACEIAPEYGVPYLERRELERLAMQKKNTALNVQDRENVSISFGVER